MIKKIILALVALSSYGGLAAQTYYNFEKGLPEGWQAKEGSLSISKEHYKEGEMSLKWSAADNNSLFLRLDSFVTKGAASLYIYCLENTNDTLTIEFRKDDQIMKRAYLLLNFKGWRGFNRPFSSYETKNEVQINNIVFKLSAGAKDQTIFIDDVNLSAKIDAKYQHGPHAAIDKKYITSGKDHLDWYTNSIDIEEPSETGAYRKTIEKLKQKYVSRSAVSTEKLLIQARKAVESYNISYNSDGTVKGDPLNTMQSIDKATMVQISETLKDLSQSDIESNIKLCRKFIDYLLDQGVSEGVNFVMNYGDYSTMRTVPKNLLIALTACTEAQHSQMLKLISWITEFGRVYNSENNYLPHLNADAITNMIPIYYAYALSHKSTSTTIRDLRAISRLLSRHTEYVPGSKDILKPDGTGFHHKTHYNGYMYALNHWIDYVYELKETPLMIDIPSYERIRKAVISMYIMAPRGTNDTRFIANSLSGRNPMGLGGSKVQVPQSNVVKLIELGGSLYNTPFDAELASAYNFFFKSKKYPVNEENYDGFYQFNYSPIGVYRSANWVVTMRSPTTKLWGAEIYNKRNRLGRYQSHGAIEVIYEGSLNRSGYLSDPMMGGWDWNVVPGATSVHYTSYSDMTPGGNTSQRFDQYTKTKNFAGALSWRDKGVFSADFDQGDNWGKQHFEPTNLTFKKSVFALDGVLICIANDISASGDYGDDMITASNLFQNAISSESSDLIVNGDHINKRYSKTLTMDNNNWLINPQSTGFIIPRGNDPVVVKYDKQKTPKQTGEDVTNPEVELLVSKAYIDHGVKTNNKEYSYIIIPNAGKAKILELNDKISSAYDNEIYQLIYHNSEVHSLLYKADTTTIYSIFEPVQNLEKGVLKSSATQLLLMVKQDATQLSFAACNPNLNPVPNAEYEWISTPTNANIVVKGRWSKIESNADNITLSKVGDNTQISFTLSEGIPLYFTLKN